MNQKTFKTPKGTELPLLTLSKKDYLQVAHRLVWFREEYPHWTISTILVESDKDHSLFRAEIKDEAGRLIASAHKREDKQGFADHTEKAETGAIGRALALCGYGTQFAADDLDEKDRLADAPLPSIYPGQPEPGDGFHHEPTKYIIRFGKWKQRSLDEVYRNEGKQEIESYINYIERKAQNDNKPIEGMVKEFVEIAEDFLGSLENSFGQPEPGSAG